MAFLLALSFNNPDLNAPLLAAAAFQVVHDAAEKEKLPYVSWRLLAHQAPSLSWWGEWDKCQRLRHSLVDHFARYEWKSEFFLQAVNRAETFNQVLDAYTRKSKGGKFLHRVALEVVNEQVSATEEQRRALLHFS